MTPKGKNTINKTLDDQTVVRMEESDEDQEIKIERRKMTVSHTPGIYENNKYGKGIYPQFGKVENNLNSILNEESRNIRM